jgi:hypothetical protein
MKKPSAVSKISSLTAARSARELRRPPASGGLRPVAVSGQWRSPKPHQHHGPRDQAAAMRTPRRSGTAAVLTCPSSTSSVTRDTSATLLALSSGQVGEDPRFGEEKEGHSTPGLPRSPKIPRSRCTTRNEGTTRHAGTVPGMLASCRARPPAAGPRGLGYPGARRARALQPSPRAGRPQVLAARQGCLAQRDLRRGTRTAGTAAGLGTRDHIDRGPG